MITYLPKVGDVGYYSFTAPFEVLSTQRIECTAIVKLIDLASTVDVLNAVYLSNGLTQEDHDNGIENDVSIARVIKPDGQVLYIPVSYFASYVVTDIVRYKLETLCVNLGALPVEISTEHILNEMKILASGLVGKECDSFIVQDTVDELITQETHDALEQERLLNVSLTNNPYKTIEEQALRIQELEEYLRLFQEDKLEE